MRSGSQAIASGHFFPGEDGGRPLSTPNEVEKVKFRAPYFAPPSA
jgi:hypothetical protein